MSLEIEYIPLQDLREYDRNARTHSGDQVEQIAASIREFGFTNPILIDNDNEIIAGHGRLAAAQIVGLTEIPAVRLSGLSSEQARALRIADNQLALNAGWDLELLEGELRALDEMSYDLDLLGFDDSFLDDLLSGVLFDSDDDDVYTDENTEVPAVERVNVSRQGDIWLCGRHRVMCGDSTSVEQVGVLADGAKADLFLTDPPYNVAYVGGTEEALTIENDEMDDESFLDFLTECFRAADEIMKPGGAYYVFHADGEPALEFRKALRRIGWPIRQNLMWRKHAMVMGRQDYHWQHEPILYGWKPGAAHYWGSDRKQTTVLDFERPMRNTEHPTMKPVSLFEYLIRNSSRRGETVLDLFGGSGTTLLASELTGRRSLTMELDPRYTDVIVRRWQDATGNVATNAQSGESFEERALATG